MCQSVAAGVVLELHATIGSYNDHHQPLEIDLHHLLLHPCIAYCIVTLATILQPYYYCHATFTHNTLTVSVQIGVDCNKCINAIIVCSQTTVNLYICVRIVKCVEN